MNTYMEVESSNSKQENIRTDDYLGDLRKKYLDSGLLDKYYGNHPYSSKIWDKIRQLSCILSGSTRMKYADRVKAHKIASDLLEYAIMIGKETKIAEDQREYTAKIVENVENFVGMPTDFFLSEILGHNILDNNGNLNREALKCYKKLQSDTTEDIDTFEFIYDNLRITISETGYGEPEIYEIVISSR